VPHLASLDAHLDREALHPYADEAAQIGKLGLIKIKPLRLHHNDRKLFRVEAVWRFAESVEDNSRAFSSVK
jgi:hypothetical protein